MRVGTFCRIIRQSHNMSLREFSSHINIPHSSIAALESGWLPPTSMTVSALLGYLSYGLQKKHFTPVSNYLSKIFLYEYAFRLYADNPFCLISWCATGILNAYLDLDSEQYSRSLEWPGDFIRLILPENYFGYSDKRVSDRELDMHVHSFLFTHICNDLSNLTSLSNETKFKIVANLAKKMNFIKAEDARRHYLTQPPPRIKKILDSLPLFPIVTQSTYRFTDFLERIKKYPPTRLPDTFSALDIFLLLTNRVELNPLNPGEISAYLTSQSGKEKRVTSYYPPDINIIGVQPSEPSLTIEEISK